MVEYKGPSYRENYPLCTKLNSVYYADLKFKRLQDKYTRLNFGGKKIPFCLFTTSTLNIHLNKQNFLVIIRICMQSNILNVFLYTYSIASNQPKFIKNPTKSVPDLTNRVP